MRREPLPVPPTPRAEAAQWLALQRSGRMTAQEARALEVWLERDASHKAALEAVDRTWRTFGEVLDDPEVMEVRDWALNGFNRPARTRLVGAIAASVVVACVGAWAAWSTGLFGDLFAQPEEQELRTGVGQTTTVTLPDGSVVTLDTDTVLRTRETGRERQVMLERGQAFFRVAKDHRRPFIVTAAGKTVTATGTAFEVRLDPQKFEVTLVEGRVTVEAPRGQFWRGQTKDMIAGWRLTAVDDRRWRLDRVDVNKETSWLSGRLTFFNDPLGQAAAEVSRYSEKKIVVAPEIAGDTIVGVFPLGDVDGFARTAQATRLARIARATPTEIDLAAPGKK